MYVLVHINTYIVFSDKKCIEFTTGKIFHSWGVCHITHSRRFGEEKKYQVATTACVWLCCHDK